MSIERDRRHWFSLTHVLTLLGLCGMIGTVWVALAADNADTKRRVTHLEQGEKATRELIKETVDPVARDVKDTKESVHQILLELRAMQAVERERERARRRRDGQ